MGLRERRIEECPTMWFNRDFFQAPWPDWTVDVDLDSLTTFFSHTNPGETIVSHPVRIKLESAGAVWGATNRFCDGRPVRRGIDRGPLARLRVRLAPDVALTHASPAR
nr:hypothetical protein [Mycobacterium sp. E2479]